MGARLTTLGIGLVAALSWGGATAAAQEAAAPDGAALYRQHCRSCHGGRGVPTQRMLTLYPTLKSLADSAFLRTHSEAQIVTVLENGSGDDMKPFKDKLTKEEMAAIARFIRTLATPALTAP